MRRKTYPDIQDILKLEPFCQPSSSYHNMLDNIGPGCYVEAESSNQAGTVDQVIRDKRGIPVCLRVRYGEDRSIDYISVDRVHFWEPYDQYVPDSAYAGISNEDYELEVQCLLEEGYWWDEEKGVFINQEGDEVVW